MAPGLPFEELFEHHEEKRKKLLFVLLVRDIYQIFGKSGNEFLTKKVLYQCVCKGVY